jgi:hypothetical protein
MCVKPHAYSGKKKSGTALHTIRDFCCILSDARSAQPDLGHHGHVDEQFCTEVLKFRIVASAAAIVLLRLRQRESGPISISIPTVLARFLHDRPAILRGGVRIAMGW